MVLEFGRLVHHELRGGDLAAVVQPARDMDGLPLLIVEREIMRAPCCCAPGRLGQHFGQFGDPLASGRRCKGLLASMAPAMSSMSFQQLLLLLQQALVSM